MEQNSLTLAHWVGKRYNSEFLRIGVSTLTLFNIAYIAGQVIGIA
ncbi:hypothetical protein [Petroclostridium sp. X23]|nr:hypothetical protein [Petroclostridium sp. X23]WHH58663.1 hypothetical protein QKW49_23185 [Petroclostridium sp. X23]